MFANARDLGYRAQAASACLNDLGLTMPFLLDDLEGSTERAYSGWPNRIFVVDRDGKVIMKGVRGPNGCQVREAEKALRDHLAAGGVKAPEVDWTGGAKAPEAPTLKDVPDGTYTGSAEGMEGPVTVELTVKAGRVTEAKVAKETESRDRAAVRSAVTEIPKRILEKQSLQVDAVSGASGTSKAIQEAARNALKSVRKPE